MDRPTVIPPAQGRDRGRRGLRLVADNGCAPPEKARLRRPTKARRLALGPDASLDDAIARILFSCLNHFTANASALRDTGDPEAVHQLRVALRRLRALLSLLKRKASVPDVDEISRQAKAIAAVLGEGRDWDVFREGLAQGPHESLGDDPAFIALLDAVELRRHRAREAARAALAAPSTAHFLGKLRDLLAGRPWRESLKGCEAKGSARVFATRALNRLHRRAMKKCVGLDGLSPQRRHRVRIALKKIRYAGEFFESLFSRKPARDYLRLLAAIQDGLGEENDRATAARFLNELEKADSAREAARAVWFLRGWSAAAAHLGESKTTEAMRRLKKLEPFWL